MTFSQYLLLKTFRNQPKRWTQTTWETLPQIYQNNLSELVDAGYAQWDNKGRYINLSVTDAGQIALIEFDLYCQTSLAL